MSLEALGWSGRWREKFEAHNGKGLVPARVVGEHRSHYRVATEATELSAGTTGRMRNTSAQRSDLPGVGDFVAVNLSEGDGPATIEVVLPRTSALIRKASGKSDPQLLAANIDVVFIVTTLGGDFNLPRMKLYLALVQQSGATSVIVVNKSDLGNDVVGTAGQIDGIASDVRVHAISARAPWHAGSRTIFRGQSHCSPSWLFGRWEIYIDEPVAWSRRASNTGSSGLRWSRPTYDNLSPIAHPTARWRHCRHSRAAGARTLEPHRSARA